MFKSLRTNVNIFRIPEDRSIFNRSSFGTFDLVKTGMKEKYIRSITVGT
jgi:hypothetical protein